MFLRAECGLGSLFDAYCRPLKTDDTKVPDSFLDQIFAWYRVVHLSNVRRTLVCCSAVRELFDEILIHQSAPRQTKVRRTIRERAHEQSRLKFPGYNRLRDTTPVFHRNC